MLLVSKGHEDTWEVNVTFKLAPPPPAEVTHHEPRPSLPCTRHIRFDVPAACVNSATLSVRPDHINGFVQQMIECRLLHNEDLNIMASALSPKGGVAGPKGE